MPRGLNAELVPLRKDSGQAERVLSELFPDPKARSRVVHLLADAIRTAARVAPASWGVSLFPARLCLNVGRGAVVQLYPAELRFIVTKRLLAAVPAKDRARFRTNPDYNYQYNFVPDAVEGWLNATDIPRYEPFRRAHYDLIERAAQNRKVCFWPTAHSPGVVEALAKAGHSLPTPDYASVVEKCDDSKQVPDIDEEERETIEGRRVLREHFLIERNSALVRKKKSTILSATGRLTCEVCGFDFEQLYGSVGFGFAEVHHITPLSASARSRSVGFDELAIVCSNCHRMLHKGNPVFTLTELRERMNDAQEVVPADAGQKRRRG